MTLKTGHRIIKTEPYSITRHPIYTGMLLALVGMVLVRDTVVGLIGFAFIATGFVLKLRHEERMLTEHFGDDYRVYRQEVPALIPHPRLRRTTAFST